MNKSRNRDPSIVKLVDFMRVKCNKVDVQKKLEEKGHPYSGTWDKVESYVWEALDSGAFDETVLSDLIIEAEFYGRQHVFIYEAPGSTLQDLQERSKIEDTMDRNGIASELLNSYRVVEMPENEGVPEVISVQHSEDHFVIAWAEKKVYWEFEGERPYEKDGKKKKERVYVEVRDRYVNILDVDLLSGEVEIRIQTLPSQFKYEEELERYGQLMHPFLDMAQLNELHLSDAIRELWEMEEVKKRQHALRDEGGNTLKLTSSGQEHGYGETRLTQRLDSEARKECLGLRANVYWLPEYSGLEREIHTILYQPNEVSVPANVRREEYKHVLQRIRAIVAGEAESTTEGSANRRVPREIQQ